VNFDDLPGRLTPGEVAQLFSVDSRTVTRWQKAGKLTARKTLGGHRRYDRDEVLRLLEQADEPDPEPKHRSYPHGGFGLACHACSKAAGQPIAWGACEAGQ
jgi:excisionase family DNA binding protein